MDAYGKFAKVYDLLMEDVPYDQIANLIEEEIKEQRIENNIVLDLACGTGTLTGLLKEKGYDVIGADLSPEMLQVAKEKLPDVLFLNQAMNDFELYGTVGTICCCLDSVNYLTEDGELDKMLHLCNNYLEPNGLLIFDVNSAYKFSHILADNIFTFDNGEIFYTWENDYDEEAGLCDFYLTFFVKEGEKYVRFDETHTERIYGKEEILTALSKNGFTVKKVLDGFSKRKATDESERLLFVCENTDSIQLKHIQSEGTR